LELARLKGDLLRQSSSGMKELCWVGREAVFMWTLAILCALCVPAYPQQSNVSRTAVIPEGRLLQPADLAQILRSPGEKPLILQVGSHVFYTEAHIPGSEYVGATKEEAGLQALRDRVHDLARDRFIVIYCGCCPWDKCPNIRPAYQQLIAMGFTNVKALYLADNFGANWVAKGYPVTKAP
jgi:thiosulfate/3-mercaptopyruvate sulfurtransferase